MNHGKYQKLVDASKAMFNDWENDNGLGQSAMKLEEALYNLDEQVLVNEISTEFNVEQEYTWLAMDIYTKCFLSTEKPTWPTEQIDRWLDWGTREVINDVKPDFLHPRQVWRRCGWVGVTPCKKESGDELWNGYWWRLVEDHNKECENCAHHDVFQDRFTIDLAVCLKTKNISPIYNMRGCKWENKK